MEASCRPAAFLLATSLYSLESNTFVLIYLSSQGQPDTLILLCICYRALSLHSLLCFLPSDFLFKKEFISPYTLYKDRGLQLFTICYRHSIYQHKYHHHYTFSPSLSPISELPLKYTPHNRPSIIYLILLVIIS